jgi:uncharacterized protein YbaA (DUF1428 family)
MARYVDGFLVPVPKSKLDAYREMSEKAGEIWRDHGALDYMECVADDLQPMEGAVVSFPESVQAKEDEVVVFAFIIYPSREDRDRINEKVMADPRMGKCDEMPFDFTRMLYGGFKGLVDLGG